MSREHQQMRVRLPPDLKDNLEQLATKNGRSMNAEIVYRLQKSIDDENVSIAPHHVNMRVYDPSIGTHKGKSTLKMIEEVLEMVRGSMELENANIAEKSQNSNEK